MLDERPSAAELIAAVAEFLEKEAAPSLPGATAFHAKVAVHALRIVERELRLSGELERREIEVVRGRLDRRDGTLEELNRELCRRIENGEIDPEDAGLRAELMERVVARMAVDSPRYASLVRG